MLRTYKIKPYSDFENWTFRSLGANWSDIYDRLLRITTKLTSHYASDVLAFINHMDRCADTGEPFDFLVFFREGGVSWITPNAISVKDANDTVEFYSGTKWLQVWRVSWIGNICADVTLARVYLTTEDAWGFEEIGM